MLEFEEAYVQLLFVAFMGRTVGTSVYDCPIRITRFVALSDTEDTPILDIVIPTETEILVPSVVLAVTFAVPADIAVTRPVLDTVTALLLEVHAIILFVTVAGIIAQDSCSVLPIAIVMRVVLMMRPAATTLVIPKEFVSTLPTMDPNPVQLSYPIFVAYLPFIPEVISW